MPDKCYKLFYNLNKNTTVQVSTASGMTETAVTAENLGQGSKSAGMVCSLSLSKGMDKYFKDSKYEIKYGNVELSPMQYQDDSIRLTNSVEGAVDGMRRFMKLMGQNSSM